MWPRAFALSLLLASCSQFSLKGEKWNLKKPQGSPWAIKKIIVSSNKLDPQGLSTLKDAIQFENGAKVEDIAYQLKYVDAFPYMKQLTYIFQGSPCQDCDNIRSLFILNPALGKAKLAFVPGVYYSASESDQHKEFEGEVYYGECLDSKAPAVYLYKVEYGPEQEQTKTLLMIEPFKENYRSRKLALNQLQELKAAFKSPFKQCHQVKKRQRIVIPM